MKILDMLRRTVDERIDELNVERAEAQALVERIDSLIDAEYSHLDAISIIEREAKVEG